jgi:hypothetical protein
MIAENGSNGQSEHCPSVGCRWGSCVLRHLSATWNRGSQNNQTSSELALRSLIAPWRQYAAIRKECMKTPPHFKKGRLCCVASGISLQWVPNEQTWQGKWGILLREQFSSYQLPATRDRILCWAMLRMGLSPCYWSLSRWCIWAASSPFHYRCQHLNNFVPCGPCG